MVRGLYHKRTTLYWHAFGVAYTQNTAVININKGECMTTKINESDLYFYDQQGRRIEIVRSLFYLTYGNSLDGSPESITRSIREYVKAGYDEDNNEYVIDDIQNPVLPKYCIETVLRSNRMTNNSDNGCSEVVLIFYLDSISLDLTDVLKNKFNTNLNWNEIAEDFPYDLV